MQGAVRNHFLRFGWQSCAIRAFIKELDMTGSTDANLLPSKPLTQNQVPPPAPAMRSGTARPGQAPRARTDHLSGAQKAAIILRVLVAEGVEMPISALPADMQARLTQTLGSMRLIDRITMEAVVAEFVEMLEQIGLSFPDGLEGALALLEGRLDAEAAQHLRALSRGDDGRKSPWARLEAAPDADLLAMLQAESTMVGAVVLSKFGIERAAHLLSLMPADQAQDLAMAVARTEDIAPDAVARIGAALAQQLTDKPLRAFSKPPARRVGEILNFSSSDLRNRLLEGIQSNDEVFADGVRKAIFTFQDIPARLSPRDVPAIIRGVDSDDLLVVLAANSSEDRESLDFLLSNMSKRLAEGLQEDATALPAPGAKTRDAALARVMLAIREMIDTGTITLQRPEDEDV